MLMYVFMLHHNRALLHLVMCGSLCWFVSFTVLISWKFLIRNMCIMLSDELRAVRNEGSCGLMYLSILYRFSALWQRCFVAVTVTVTVVISREFLI